MSGSGRFGHHSLEELGRKMEREATIACRMSMPAFEAMLIVSEQDRPGRQQGLA
jgi:hypothetical protein